MKKVDVSIILACYNEGPTFEKSVAKIIKVLSSLKRRWEIIFVEDKSTDQTLEKIKSLLPTIGEAKLIAHNQNQGRGKSVSDGMLVSQGKICGYLDVDLEISADYIPIFVDEIENGRDAVVGRRYYEGSLNSIVRFFASKFYSFLVRQIIKIPITDTESGCKFFNRKEILPILKKVKSSHWFWDTEICARAYWSGLSIRELPVLFIRRIDKQSTVKLVPDTLDYVKNLLSFKKEIPKAFR